MAETYKKIDNNTLEIVSTSIRQNTRKHLENEKQKAQQEILEAQKRIDTVDIKLTVLNKE